MDIYVGLIFPYKGKNVEVVKMDFYNQIIICNVLDRSEGFKLLDLDREVVENIIRNM